MSQKNQAMEEVKASEIPWRHNNTDFLAEDTVWQQSLMKPLNKEDMFKMIATQDKWYSEACLWKGNRIIVQLIENQSK